MTDLSLLVAAALCCGVFGLVAVVLAEFGPDILRKLWEKLW